MAIPFEGGFTAKWNTSDENYVDLVNLEWTCSEMGSETKVTIHHYKINIS